MKAFAVLYAALDASQSTNDKVNALADYFRAAPPADAAWGVQLLMGNRPKRVLSAPRLRALAAQAADLPLWLVEASHHQAGDLAETVALLVGTDETGHFDEPLADTIEQRLLPLRGLDESAQRELVFAMWRRLDRNERLVWNKLLTGAFRVGVASGLVTRALAQVADLPVNVLAHRLMGARSTTADAWAALVAPDDLASDLSRPYPFCLATPIGENPADLGDPDEFLAEWKWDGIRAQLIRRGGSTWLWSRGEDLLNGRFPEIEVGATRLPDGTVIDGEILGWANGADQPLPFAQLQRRIQRKRVTSALLDEVPATFVAYDLLEAEGTDLRALSLAVRRDRLAPLVALAGTRLRLSARVTGDSWADLTAQRGRSRAVGAEGLMIKRLDAPYGVGRRRGAWWKWKVDPMSVDAVMTAAQSGSGRRAGLFTDYTFGVWHDGKLVTFAKAYSGLTDAEIRRVDNFVRRNTVERFGPVRTVEPELVFEIAFEGIQRSSRHKSGVAVRFPRIARWRTDKRAEDADTLDTVMQLLDAQP